MAWTAPRTWATGEIVTAVMGNAHWRDNLRYLKGLDGVVAIESLVEWKKGADIASAAALTLGTDGNYFVVTGTTTITSISTQTAGTIIVLRFSGALTFTYNATNLILQDSKNLTTAAGDMVSLISEGSGNWRELSRRLATAVTGALTRTGGQTTEATTTSTTEVDLLSATVTAMVAATPFFLGANFRKSLGAAARTQYGVKLNTTSIIPQTGSNFQFGTTDSADAVDNGYGVMFIGARVTSYLRPYAGFSSSITTDAAGPSQANADAPTADITTVVILGWCGNAAITAGADELHVFSLATT